MDSGRRIDPYYPEYKILQENYISRKVIPLTNTLLYHDVGSIIIYLVF